MKVRVLTFKNVQIFTLHGPAIQKYPYFTTTFLFDTPILSQKILDFNIRLYIIKISSQKEFIMTELDQDKNILLLKKQ